mmetsp:Transcript_16135/g.23735  ORF Transcript_16135/g.23735 Transcript_16135/m.23735 type:complete len:98 (-) Transcript_16135:167-460(-)|eukprot:CAMPEP_0194210576 /NCGR_PEP_ID=MMETSP0156-20130528/8763_1 /TAXON_ID=33649 /ORGANISM="Thalassionema nitzschioides, Strain L26-B" /LENGTH=97 /DNA_ID=CAMNT_0038937939 /DNA_START=200 /DNA_END=493 /DNA_ORIENTATION=+
MNRTYQRLMLSSEKVLQAMKPGSPIKGLNFFKGKNAPVALQRSEYPDWVNDLVKSPISLAKLKKMDEEDASDREKMRYLKLTRRLLIKENNIEAGED